MQKELRWEDVRSVCIDHDLFTNGSNKDYDTLLFDVVNKIDNVTDKDLIEIASIIKTFSITDYSLSTICTLLNEKIFIHLDQEEIDINDYC